MLKKLIGNRQFYKRVLILTLPIMIQNGITNFVNMLDNVMVGRVGTIPMTGVAVTNQLIFVFNLCIFGTISGAGIFSAQFYGKGDHKGVRDTFRFKLISGTVISLIGIGVFLLFGTPLINLYLKGEGSTADAVASLFYAKEYLIIMLIGFIPYMIAQCYSSTLRECGESVLPMVAGVSAVFVNLILNYVLIFGNFGAPKLGVKGAAIATVISRFVELIIVVVFTRFKAEKMPFIMGAYRSLCVPAALVKQIFIKGMPLMLNEAFWASGMAILNQCYSVRGLNVVAAVNISQTFFNVFSVAFMAVGVAIGIILGQTLGSSNHQKAKEESVKLIAFSVFVSVLVGAVYFFAAKLIPNLYNTNDGVRIIATRLMQITALVMPINAFAHASYFTLRSGGKTFITILFDSCFVWVVSIPVAFMLTRFTGLNILVVYLICQLVNIIKCILGFIFVRKGIWIRNIVQ